MTIKNNIAKGLTALMLTNGCVSISVNGQKLPNSIRNVGSGYESVGCSGVGNKALARSQAANRARNKIQNYFGKEKLEGSIVTQYEELENNGGICATVYIPHNKI